MFTDLEVLAEGFGAHGTLQLGALTLAAVGQRPLRQRVARSCLTVVTQQFVLATELQVAHLTGEELHAHVGEGVGDPGGSVWE